MKVFLSWSGALSQSYASIFSEWLPSVLNAIDPFHSTEDIDKGKRWSEKLSNELNASFYGIIFLTPDNVSAPWIMFEAGCLARDIEKSKVCTLLFGLEPTDITGPLEQFQATHFNKDDILKLILSLNNSSSPPITEKTVLNTFEMCWSKLDKQIEEAKQKVTAPSDAPIKRPDRDLLEEILESTRKITKQTENQAPQIRLIPSMFMPNLKSAIEEYMNEPQSVYSSNDLELLEKISEHIRLLHHISGYKISEVTDKLLHSIASHIKFHSSQRESEDDYDPFSQE
jgi:hypothetical protein